MMNVIKKNPKKNIYTGWAVKIGPFTNINTNGINNNNQLLRLAQ